MTFRNAKTDARLIAALRSGLNLTQACKAVGVGRTAFYGWRRSDPVFAAVVDEAKAHGVIAKAKAAIAPWLATAA